MGLTRRGITALIILLVVIIACTYYLTVNNLNHTPLRKPFSPQEKEMINITLSDDTVKSLLVNRSYDISVVNISGQYVLIDVDKNEPMWSCLMVGVDSVNNTTTYAYNLMFYCPGMSHIDDRGPALVKIATDNQSVKNILCDQILNVHDDYLYKSHLIFNLRNVTNLTSAEVFPGPSGGLYIGIDIDNNTITGIEYCPPYNQADVWGNIENMSVNAVYNNTPAQRYAMHILVQDLQLRRAVGMNDSQIVNDLAMNGTSYDPETGNLTIGPQSFYYKRTGQFTFSTSWEYLIKAGVISKSNSSMIRRGD